MAGTIIWDYAIGVDNLPEKSEAKALTHIRTIADLLKIALQKPDSKGEK
jgi:hypothetical protein